MVSFKYFPKMGLRKSLTSSVGLVIIGGKIKNYWCKFLIDKVVDRFPDLFPVTDEAVNCRNHYVHGSPPSFDYRDYSSGFDAITFFTDTLEFVFAASDLIEAGGDVKGWCEIPTSMSHPFGSYRVCYADNLRKLKSRLAKH
ncbi:MAG: hypothetical protein M1438_03760 [Deltaproteobacteria bacterium]|nr:hypothetical protein [Deltaproteobacteria bacterium]